MEEAHLKYLEAAQVDLDDNQEEANYLNQPSQDWEDAHKTYGDFLKEKSNMEKVAKFQTKLKVLEASILNFGSPAEDVSNLIKEGISSTDVRADIKKIKEMAKKLIDKKDDLCSISSGIKYFDAGELKMRFRKVVIDEVKKARVIFSPFLKDSCPNATSAEAVMTCGGTSHSNTKR